MVDYIPVNKVGMILQVGGMNAEKINETIEANNRKLDQRFVNEMGNDNVNSMQVKNSLIIKDKDIYREIENISENMKKFKNDFSENMKKINNDISENAKKINNDISENMKKINNDISENAKKINNDISENAKKINEIENKIRKDSENPIGEMKFKIDYIFNYSDKAQLFIKQKNNIGTSLSAISSYSRRYNFYIPKENEIIKREEVDDATLKKYNIQDILFNLSFQNLRLLVNRIKDGEIITYLNSKKSKWNDSMDSFKTLRETLNNIDKSFYNLNYYSFAKYANDFFNNEANIFYLKEIFPKVIPRRMELLNKYTPKKEEGIFENKFISRNLSGHYEGSYYNFAEIIEMHTYKFIVNLYGKYAKFEKQFHLTNASEFGKWESEYRKYYVISDKSINKKILFARFIFYYYSDFKWKYSINTFEKNG